MVTWPLLHSAAGSNRVPGCGVLPSRYFEERFDVESWAMGYITSYTAGVSFIVQVSVGVGAVFVFSWRDRFSLETGSPGVTRLRMYP